MANAMANTLRHMANRTSGVNPSAEVTIASSATGRTAEAANGHRMVAPHPTYTYRDQEKRKSYMREYMRKKRAKKPR
jgi:hypothetical protein